jgi:ABC-type dipeptide/oligopeptide/nickel transport system ATPase component/ABC-type dipeptide/oligopeptide/nickel transport system permease subunit
MSTPVSSPATGTQAGGAGTAGAPGAPGTPGTQAGPAASSSTRQARGTAFSRLLRKPEGVISLVIIALVILVGILAPLLSPQDPNFVNLDIVKAPASPEHLLGGDSQGRDVLSRLIWGTQTTVYGAAIAVAFSLLLGVPSGVAAGYFGGAFDRISMWVSDALQAVPGMIILLIVAAASGSNFVVIMITVGVFMAPGFYRLTRSTVLSVRSEPYVDAAVVAGMSPFKILLKHVLRTVRGPVIIQTSLTAGMAMGMQAGLQFLSIGTSDTPSWGAMMMEGFTIIRQHPTLMLWPSLALGLTIAALAIFGTALGDALAVRPPAKRLSAARKAVQAHDAAVPGSTGQVTLAGAESAVRIDELRVAYPSGKNTMKEVVHGISLDVRPGEVLGLVGESGSGKSQTVFSLLGLLPETAAVGAGELWINGTRVDLANLGAHRKLLGTTLGYIPQEPMSNLDPSYTVGYQLTEPLRTVHGRSKEQARAEVLAALTRVGITDPERVLRSYPHQLSGGMAQRVLIAGAVAGKPKVLVADEPTTALDVTVQAEVLELLRELQREDGMALVIVTHNFGVVADLCDRVVVMKDGSVVETGTVDEVFNRPADPYTAELIAACLDDAEPRVAADARFADASGADASGPDAGPVPAGRRAATPTSTPASAEGEAADQAGPTPSGTSIEGSAAK